MAGPARVDKAVLLAALAIFGFAVAPLAHAEEHWRESHEDAAELQHAWEDSSHDDDDALAAALRNVHGSRRDTPAPHQHSHGPGAHGAGSLAHLALALHASAPPPQVAAPAVTGSAPSKLSGRVPPSLPYLVSEWPQGPPATC